MRIGYYKGKEYSGKTFAELVHKIAQDEAKSNDQDSNEQLPDANSSPRLSIKEWVAPHKSSEGYKH